MIQRKQTLFLFQLVFLGIALLFIPSATVVSNNVTSPVFLVPVKSAEFASSAGHIAAIGINFLALVLTFITVFMYKRRELQLKMAFVLIFIWVVLTLMLAFCPFISATDEVTSVHTNYLPVIIGVVGIIAAYLVAKYIKKDIELIKSADRIR